MAIARLLSLFVRPKIKEMSESRYKIKKVFLRSGFIDIEDDKSKCEVISFEGGKIPQDVIETLKKENYETLKTEYGDPSWGEPIQYDLLIVDRETERKKIEVFNRAILLIFQNTEETRRLHRILYAIEKYKK